MAPHVPNTILIALFKYQFALSLSQFLMVGSIYIAANDVCCMREKKVRKLPQKMGHLVLLEILGVEYKCFIPECFCRRGVKTTWSIPQSETGAVRSILLSLCWF